MKRILIIILALSGACRAWACDEDDDWAFFDQLEKAEHVNEGEFVILGSAPEQDAHQHLNTITIERHSLETGWVGLQQCHRHLDAVPALQIVFSAERTRDLVITSATNVARAWVEGNTVQLEDISDDSEICLSASTRALDIDSRSPTLKTGPYMRKFLDGYYPLRVQLKVRYPAGLLRVVRSAPQTFKRLTGDSLLLDLWFEGELRTEVEFGLLK